MSIKQTQIFALFDATPMTADFMEGWAEYREEWREDKGVIEELP